MIAKICRLKTFVILAGLLLQRVTTNRLQNNTMIGQLPGGIPSANKYSSLSEIDTNT